MKTNWIIIPQWGECKQKQHKIQLHIILYIGAHIDGDEQIINIEGILCNIIKIHKDRKSSTVSMRHRNPLPKSHRINNRIKTKTNIFVYST